MANALSSTYQSGLMYMIFNGQTFNKPASLYVGLATNPPTNTSVTEVPNVGGYTRINVPNDAAHWAYVYPNSGLMTNVNAITFPAATAYVGWSSGVFISDTGVYGGGISLAGNICFQGSYSPAKEINVNDQVFVPSSGLLVRMY